MSSHRRTSWASSIGFALAIVVGSASVSWALTYHCAAEDVQCVVLAIHQANLQPTRRHVINLDPATYTFQSAENDTDGPNALPSVTSRITIRVLGDGVATLTRASGVPGFRLLHVGPGGDVTLRDVAISGFGVGLGTSGGAILNAGGSVDIARSTFRENRASRGGALANLDGTMNIASSTFTRNGGDSGLAIFNRGVLTVRGTTVSEHNGLQGGGIYHAGGTAEIIGTEVSFNSARFGGGGLWISSGSVSVTRSTFRGNDADGAGAVFVEVDATLAVSNSAFVENLGTVVAGIDNRGWTTVENSTFAGNRGSTFLALGPIDVRSSGFMFISGTTFAGATAPPPTGPSRATVISGGANTSVINSIITRDPNAIDVRCGNFQSLGGNVVGDFASCGVVLHETDHFGVEPGLGDLIDDGRPGRAHFPLLPTSVAIGAAVQTECSTEDQLGRPRRGSCDSGAVEFRRRTVLAVSPQRVVAGDAVTITWSGIAAPTPTDWIGLYYPSTDHGQFLDWIYVSCSQTPDNPHSSGSCSYSVPSWLPPGRYELRLLANDQFTDLLATSAPLRVD